MKKLDLVKLTQPYDNWHYYSDTANGTISVSRGEICIVINERHRRHFYEKRILCLAQNGLCYVNLNNCEKI